MPSQTQIAFDLNTLYTRYDSSGTNSGAGGSVGAGVTISYYGYSTPGTQDSTTSFSIKKVYYIGTVKYVDWNNNTQLHYFKHPKVDAHKRFATHIFERLK